MEITLKIGLENIKKHFKLYFTLIGQCVEIVSIYLKGIAEVWFEGYMRNSKGMASQDDFTKGICMIFGNKEKAVEEFNKLTQQKGIKEYIEKFEELKSLMIVKNLTLPESYYISSFISGLKKVVKPMLKILKLITLIQAFEQSKWQEKSKLTMARRNKMATRSMVPINTNRLTNN